MGICVCMHVNRGYACVRMSSLHMCGRACGGGGGGGRAREGFNECLRKIKEFGAEVMCFIPEIYSILHCVKIHVLCCLLVYREPSSTTSCSPCAAHHVLWSRKLRYSDNSFC